MVFCRISLVFQYYGMRTYILFPFISPVVLVPMSVFEYSYLCSFWFLFSVLWYLYLSTVELEPLEVSPCLALLSPLLFFIEK